VPLVAQGDVHGTLESFGDDLVGGSNRAPFENQESYSYDSSEASSDVPSNPFDEDSTEADEEADINDIGMRYRGPLGRPLLCEPGMPPFHMGYGEPFQDPCEEPEIDVTHWHCHCPTIFRRSMQFVARSLSGVFGWLVGYSAVDIVTTRLLASKAIFGISYKQLLVGMSVATMIGGALAVGTLLYRSSASPATKECCGLVLDVGDECLFCSQGRYPDEVVGKRHVRVRAQGAKPNSRVKQIVIDPEKSVEEYLELAFKDEKHHLDDQGWFCPYRLPPDDKSYPGGKKTAHHVCKECQISVLKLFRYEDRPSVCLACVYTEEKVDNRYFHDAQCK
jgi:hypothetical protein